MSNNDQRLDPAILHEQLEQAFSEYKEKSEARIQALYNENKVLKAEVAHLKSSENEYQQAAKSNVGPPNEGTSGGAIEPGGPEGDVKPRVQRTFDVPTDTWLPKISASSLNCGHKQDSESDFPGSLDEIWQECYPHLGSTFAEQFPQLRVPDPDGPDRDPPSFLWAQPSTVYPPAHEARHPAFFPSSPYHPTRASFFPVQSASPNETALHTRRWVRDDGMPCGAQITRADRPQHFTSHGVKGFAHDHSLSCWDADGDKAKMKRKNILRHVMEVHLGHRRAFN
ncbi:hypothetical protein HD554DRAFT_2170921 [Boletus coccyginus]|nr:hypothetical protein HD554DRAFT_2170921 [Boletus coccyginus]